MTREIMWTLQFNPLRRMPSPRTPRHRSKMPKIHLDDGFGSKCLSIRRFKGAAERVRRAHGKPMHRAFAHSMVTSWAWANAFRPSLGVRNAG